MAETYPASLPLPEDIGYTGVQSYGLVQTNLPGPVRNQDTYYNAARVLITATWAMDDATYDTWLAWIKANGYRWFYLQVISPRTPVDITSEQLVRCVSPAAHSLSGHNWQRVSLSLELIPAGNDDPLAPTPVYSDFIEGGTPAAPAPDTIEAGTPAAPSTPDIITASLYAYGY